ncbi:hypothetical protein A3F05_02585 [Candidatus Saccharibacteria bacterium RIFCSPHIGHO2_12_FULL_47_17]|nr:MAG: hypothetical protein A3F05_02585 [Candidatus Saccharibacteria bacterium RIFCSPHIGHO2_12_FULL_47_17]
MAFPEALSQASDDERQIPRPRLERIGGAVTRSPSYDEFYAHVGHEPKSTRVATNEKVERPATGSFGTNVELEAYRESRRRLGSYGLH